MKEEIRKIYRVREKVIESPMVVTLKLSIEDGSMRGAVPQYRPGQFITIYFPELGTPEGKSYSISSAPHETTINITVKGIGLFSNKLCGLNEGSTFAGSLPYGYFYSEDDTTDLVMVAGGIGIAPFRSMVIDALTRTPERKLALFYSSREVVSIIFKKEFEALAAKHPNFKILNFITREKSQNPLLISERISVTDLIGNAQKGSCHINGREFMLCGSIPFVGDFWKGLVRQGVPQEVIYTEAFFSH